MHVLVLVSGHVAVNVPETFPIQLASYLNGILVSDMIVNIITDRDSRM